MGGGAVDHVASTLSFHRAIPPGAPSPAELRAALLAALPRLAGADPPKALLVLALVYVVSPLDVIPDFIPVIGEMDDIVVVLSGLWLFIRLCPPEVVRETVCDIAARAKARG